MVDPVFLEVRHFLLYPEGGITTYDTEMPVAKLISNLEGFSQGLDQALWFIACRK